MKLIGMVVSCAFLSSLRAAPEPGPDQPTLPSCRWEIVEKSCTSCSEEDYFDSECKRNNNGDYRSCVEDEETCTNGALCDADSGFGDCD
jgi:hypothetical protein